MKFKLPVECDCGNQDVLIPKRTINKIEGRVYEDYSSITEGSFEKGTFFCDQYHENDVSFTCLKCGDKHDLTT